MDAAIEKSVGRAGSGRPARRLLVAACALSLAMGPGPALSKSAEPWSRWLPDSYRSGGGATTPRPQAWWTEFQNDELNELVDLALDNNFDLRAAVSRVAQAQADAAATSAGRLPTLDAIARAQYLAPEFGIGTAPTRGDFRTRQIYQFGLRTDYEVDLWGRAAYDEKAALARVRSSGFSREALALSLTGDVVATYFTYLSLQEREAQVETRVSADEELLKAVRRRQTLGDAGALETEQQAAATQTARAELAALQAQRERTFVQLAFLIGRPPQMLHLQGGKLADVAVPDIPISTPAGLLCQRPDVRRAEAELAAANADVAAARAGMFPALNLSAAAGYGSNGLTDVFAPQRLFLDLSSQLVQSVFDGGRRAAVRDSGLARKTALLEAYQGAILAAVRDVEQANAALRLAKEREEAAAKAAASSDRLVTLTERAWRRGAQGYPALLEARRGAALARDAALTARLDRLRAATDLYKAVGGGSDGEKACAAEAAAAATKTKGKRW